MKTVKNLNSWIECLLLDKKL